MSEYILLTPPGQEINIRMTHQSSSSDVYITITSPACETPQNASVRHLLSLHHPHLPVNPDWSLTRLRHDPPHFLIASPLSVNAMEETKQTDWTEQSEQPTWQVELSRMKKTFEESLAAMEQRTIEGEKRTLKREEEQRKASQLELAILTDRLNEAVGSIGRQQRKHRSAILFAAIRWINVEIGAAKSEYEDREPHSARDHKSKHALVRALQQPRRHRRILLGQSTGRGHSIITLANAHYLNRETRVSERNDASHLEGNTPELLSALMGLELHAFNFGRIETTAEGIALAFVVLIMGRDRYTSLIRHFRANPVDYDFPDLEQLFRIRTLWRR